MTRYAGPLLYALVTLSQWKKQTKFNTCFLALRSVTSRLLPIVWTWSIDVLLYQTVVYHITNYLSKEHPLYPSTFYPRVSCLMSRSSLFWLAMGRAPLALSFSRFLTQFSFTLFYYMLNHSRTRKKRRRRAAYGRSLYKINNDTSTKFIEGIVIIIVIIVVVVAVRSRRIIVLKKVTSYFFFPRLAARCSCTRAKLTWQVCATWMYFEAAGVNDPYLPYILFDHLLLCASIYAIRVFVNLHWYTCAFSVRRDSNASLRDYHDLWLAHFLFPDCDTIFMVLHILSCPIPLCIGKSNSQPIAGAVVNGAFSAVNSWTSIRDGNLSTIVGTRFVVRPSNFGILNWEYSRREKETIKAVEHHVPLEGSRRKSLRKGRRKRKCVPDAADSSWLSALLSALVLDSSLPHIFFSFRNNVFSYSTQLESLDFS